jgi:hypothetical protein
VTDERWQLAYTIYEAAISLTEPERQQYVRASAPDAEIAGKAFANLEIENHGGSDVLPESECSANAGSMRSLTSGSRLGPYEILDRISRVAWALCIAPATPGSRSHSRDARLHVAGASERPEPRRTL